MCDCWLIERAATPIASTGGAASSTGTTSSVSIATVHGQRGWSRSAGAPTTSQIANTRRHTPTDPTPPPPRGGEEKKPVADGDPRPTWEARAPQQRGRPVEPILRQ